MENRSLGSLAVIAVVLSGLLLALFGWLLREGYSIAEVLCMAPLDIAAYSIMGAMLWLVFTDRETAA